MLLKDWIDKNNLNVPRFCKLIDLTPPTIYLYLKGVKRISADTAVKIEEVTQGEVTRVEAMWPELLDNSWVLNRDHYGYGDKYKKKYKNKEAK